jgi:hypothetical protein
LGVIVGIEAPEFMYIGGGSPDVGVEPDEVPHPMVLVTFIEIANARYPDQANPPTTAAFSAVAPAEV